MGRSGAEIEIKACYFLHFLLSEGAEKKNLIRKRHLSQTSFGLFFGVRRKERRNKNEPSLKIKMRSSFFVLTYIPEKRRKAFDPFCVIC